MMSTQTSHRAPAFSSQVSRFTARAAVLSTVAVIIFSLLCACGLSSAPISRLFMQSAYAQDTSQNATPAISINSATPTITKDSGYSASLTLTNTTDADLPESTLAFFTAPQFSFRSSSHMDQWAQGSARISTPYQLAHVRIPALTAGAHKKISVHVDGNADTLQALRSWGAKPLLIQWITEDNAVVADAHTFFTRANDMASTQDLPKIKFVVALPLSTSNALHCTDSKSTAQFAKTDVQSLLDAQTNPTATNSRDSATSAKNSTTHVVTSSCATADIARIAKLYNQYPQLQIISDLSLLPATQKSLSARDENSLQPYGIDIAALAQSVDNSTSQLISQHTLQTLPEHSIQVNSKHLGYAWQGEGQWTQESLKSASQWGYNTVVATNGYATRSDNAIHNSVMRADIDGTPMTILNAQSELSTLMQGKATSSNALAEKSSAGRLNRLIAQSAFYEAQAPYEDRTVLISAATLGKTIENTDIAFIRTAMDALNNAPWTSFADMTSLTNSESFYSSQQVSAFVQNESHLSSMKKHSIAKLVRDIDSSRTAVTNFDDAVLDKNAQNQKDQQAQRDPQELANGSIDKNINEFTADAWMKNFYALNDFYAAQALSTSSMRSYALLGVSAQVKAHSIITHAPYSALQVSVPESIHVVSESASVPVTITNNLPVTVKVKVGTQPLSKVSSEVRVDSSDVLTIAAHNRQQITLPIHAISGWNVTFNIFLTSSQGEMIGTAQSLKITSSFTILDNAGYAIFALALLLAVVGARRQVQKVREKRDNRSKKASKAPHNQKEPHELS